VKDVLAHPCSCLAFLKLSYSLMQGASLALFVSKKNKNK
jgi:hypothetical protein